MSGLTDAERRGARMLAVLLVLGTISDVYRAHRPVMAPPASAVSPVADSSVRPPEPDPGARAGVEPIDPNTASVEELDRLPGIGPVLARRIVEHRVRYGPFRSADELLGVQGIGARLLERLRPFVRVTAR